RPNKPSRHVAEAVFARREADDYVTLVRVGCHAFADLLQRRPSLLSHRESMPKRRRTSPLSHQAWQGRSRSITRGGSCCRQSACFRGATRGFTLFATPAGHGVGHVTRRLTPLGSPASFTSQGESHVIGQQQFAGTGCARGGKPGGSP